MEDSGTMSNAHPSLMGSARFHVLYPAYRTNPIRSKINHPQPSTLLCYIEFETYSTQQRHRHNSLVYCQLRVQLVCSYPG